jgi:hypothetical protein
VSATPPAVSRRTAIGVAALTAAVVSGCTDDGPEPGQPQATPERTPLEAPQSPDVALAARVLADEQRMLDLVLATARRHPRLAGAVAGARAAHRSHVALLRNAVPKGSSPSATPRTAPAVPARPAPALAALARAETRHATAGSRGALAARSGPFARVLGSMAAAAAQQAAVLGAAAARARR